MNRGFTLIEILIAVSIIGLTLTVVMPVSYSMYKSHKDALEAEKVLLLLSAVRREAFMYGREASVDTQNDRLVIDGKLRDETNNLYIHAERPILFYKNGTTTGGRVQVNMEDYRFVITIDSPLGEMKLERQ